MIIMIISLSNLENYLQLSPATGSPELDTAIWLQENRRSSHFVFSSLRKRKVPGETNGNSDRTRRWRGRI